MNEPRYRPGRRGFIKRVCGLGVALSCCSGWSLAKQANPLKKPIPVTGEQLPVIGMGTSRTFDVGDDARARAVLLPVLQAFFDRGGAVIDSSPMYGSAEQVMGDLLRKLDNKAALFAATKVWTYGKQDGIEQMQRSMQRIGVEVFDLMQIHNLRDWQGHLETLQDMETAGAGALHRHHHVARPFPRRAGEHTRH